MVPVRTRSQKLSEEAWKLISGRTLTAEYKSRARSFPALVHRAGLSQALAFQAAKGPHEYGADLDAVLKVLGLVPSGKVLAEHAHSVSVSPYMTLTRHVMEAAQWIRRSVDAMAPGEEDE